VGHSLTNRESLPTVDVEIFRENLTPQEVLSRKFYCLHHGPVCGSFLLRWLQSHEIQAQLKPRHIQLAHLATAASCCSFSSLTTMLLVLFTANPTLASDHAAVFLAATRSPPCRHSCCSFSSLTTMLLLIFLRADYHAWKSE
jgi:hypothetical protein